MINTLAALARRRCLDDYLSLKDQGQTISRIARQSLTRQTVCRIFADRAEAMRIAVQWQPAAKAKALSTAAN